MQCRYKGKIVSAGEMLFGVVYGTYRKAGARRGKFRESSDVQKKLNERHSREYLTWLIHENFDRNACSFDPTYSDECYPDSKERFEKDIRNYIQRVARLYKKAGCEFKWICIRAYGEEKGRLHLHFIFSGGVSKDEIKAAWGMGRLNYKELEFDECGVVDLSAYIADQRHAGARRWSGSRNLKKPEEKTDRNQWSKADLCDIDDAGSPHKFFADRYPGYYLSEFPQIMKNPVNGTYYMTFVMYKPDGANLAKYARR